MRCAGAGRIGPISTCFGIAVPVHNVEEPFSGVGRSDEAMRPRIWLPAAMAALSLTLLGCGGSGGSDEGSAPEGSPEQGTCWAAPSHSVFDWAGDHWVDDSPQVPCTE